MKPLPPSRSAAPLLSLLGAGAVCLAVVLAGCGADRALAPESGWEEVRYHWTASAEGAFFGDVVVQPSGEIEWVLQGQSASTRGLLAGENLETLARLIDALPPADYSGAADCSSSFFLSMVVDGQRRSYSGGACDPDLPEALRAISEQFEQWAVEDWVNKPEVVAFRLLARGEQSQIEEATRRTLRSRDALLQVVQLLGEDRPAILPAVDFQREIVLALFLGTRPSEGYGVTVAGAHRTDGGQVLLNEVWEIPGDGCPVARTITAPWALVAVTASPDDDLLFEIERLERECGTSGSGEPE